ncbi:hypothetical protein [Salinibacter ruber]|uniref:hypothetical protein n=1 Tax=Salinibacter ruber TaxID=146919 RepID=UPI001608A0B0|nr:hypothetical protein [Salinibacter ruber]
MSVDSGVLGFPPAFGMQAKHVFGNLEPKVTDRIVDYVSKIDTFWNIGSGWGYHALVASQFAKKVIAFEALGNRVYETRRSIKKMVYLTLK